MPKNLCALMLVVGVGLLAGCTTTLPAPPEPSASPRAHRGTSPAPLPSFPVGVTGRPPAGNTPFDMPDDLANGQNPPAVPALKELERGQASWYGLRFHGRRTASGERYDQRALTAAHKTLPFGTLVRVRSLVTGKEIEVRVNDRGPFARGRIIDVSRAAAEALGMTMLGVKQVSLHLAESASPVAGSQALPGAPSQNVSRAVLPVLLSDSIDYPVSRQHD